MAKLAAVAIKKRKRGVSKGITGMNLKMNRRVIGNESRLSEETNASLMLELSKDSYSEHEMTPEIERHGESKLADRDDSLGDTFRLRQRTPIL